MDNLKDTKNGLELNTTTGEEIANFISHTVGAGLAIIAFILLTIRGAWTQNVSILLSFMTFGLGLIILYTMSSIYHGLKPGKAKMIFEILDHSAIYILIAASYTPFIVTGVKSLILCAQWTICILGIVFKAFFTGRFRLFSTLLYLFMGWMVIFSWNELITNIPIISIIWLIIGGISFSLGTIFYMWRICKFNHMIWHLFVLVGSISHFFAVFYLV